MQNKIARKILGASIVIGIAYGAYRLLKETAELICEELDEECQEFAQQSELKQPAMATSSRPKKKPAKKKK